MQYQQLATFSPAAADDVLGRISLVGSTKSDLPGRICSVEGFSLFHAGI